jgi:RNA polymerase sigma factor (TIGR02999 family)
LEGRITELLQRAGAGDSAAADELLPMVYAELHRLARKHMRGERPGHTLQATALVNEAYMRMVGQSNAAFPDRARFLAFASRLMRNILVDYARARNSAKRGGPGQDAMAQADLDDVSVDETDRLISVLDLSTALDALAGEHARAAEAIELRYFGGLTAEETAAALDRSVHAVQHDLRFGHAWLRRRLAGSPAE